MILFSAMALAAPDRLARQLFDTHVFTDLALSSDGEMLAASTGQGTLVVVDVYAWATDEATLGCTTTEGLAAAWYSSGWRVYLGCDDGSIVVFTMDAYGRLDDEADFATVATGGAVLGLETDDSYVYAVYDDGDGGLAVSAFSIADGTEWSTYYPVTVNDTAVMDTAYADNIMYITHGGDDITKVTTNTGDVIGESESLGGKDFGDVWAYSSAIAYIADGTGDVISFTSSGNDLAIAADDVADEVTGVTVNGDEAWMMIASPEIVYQYGYDGFPADEEAQIAVAGVSEMVAIDGYALGASSGGLAVMTDRPWVDGVTLYPTTAGTGAQVSLSFTPDTAGTWSVNSGGADVLASGSADAGEGISTSFKVSSSFDEGDHRIYVDFTAGGMTGTGSAILSVNNPPDQIDLDTDDVLPGNESIHIDIDSLDSDVTYVDVYLETFPWDSADFPVEGGPEYEGPDKITNPVSVAVTDGVTREVVVSGLTNDTTYYVAVRARDSSGLEGPMSVVIPVTPQQTYTMLDYYNDDTPFCGVSGQSSGWLGLLAGLGLALRRRSRGAAALAGLALLTLPSLAHAREPDLTARKWNLEVRYGAIMSQSDKYIKGAFGESGNSMLRVDYGWCSNLLEFDFGTGIYRDEGTLLTESGGPTGDKTYLTVLPFELSLTGRLDFLDEQPAVPFARIGVGYSLFVQDWQEDPSEDLLESRAGGRLGWFWGAGVMFLLDGLDRGAASSLEATTGINDTYIVAEYRSNYGVQVDDNLDLSQSDLTFGLKFDF